MLFIDEREELKRQIVKERGNKLNFYVWIANKRNELVLQNYDEALKKFYDTKNNSSKYTIQLRFIPDKDDKEFQEEVIIQEKYFFFNQNKLRTYGCNESFIRKIWNLPSDKLYEVKKDNELPFSTDNQMTIRMYACQAIEWLWLQREFYGEKVDINAEWLLKDTIKEIEKYFALGIGEVVYK